MVLAGLLALGATDAAADEVDVVQLDSARSHVGFRVKVMWLLSLTGEFGRVHGSVRNDRFRNQLRVDARIDADSVAMDSRRYETWVKSPEFFDVSRYPQIEFASEPFAQSRLRNGGELVGTLILRGVHQPVIFELQPSTCERPAYDCPIEVRGTIRRSAFAMGSRRGTLSDKVELNFSVYAELPPTTAPTAER